MVVLRVVGALCALLAILSANGWMLHASIAHALGWLAGSALAFVLSTIPVGTVA